MKVRCDRDSLEKACALAGSVVPGRTTKPALACLKLETRDKYLVISATDEQLGIRYRVAGVEIIEPGAAVLSAERLTGILRESRDEAIELETDGDSCRITCADSRFRIFGFDPAEFPKIAEFPDAPGFTIQAGVLKTMIGRTIFAAAKDVSRYAINGVLLEPKGGRLKMVGTDGKRLAQARGDLLSEATDERAAVCPLKAMALLDRLLVDPESDVEVKLTDNDLRVRVGPAVLISRLVEGTYPKYDDVIPKECDKTAELDSTALQSAVKRAALLVTPDSKRVVFRFGPDKLDLRSSTPDHGEAEVTLAGRPPGPDGKPDGVSAYAYIGSPLRIEFNPDFVIDGIKALGTERVHWEFKNPDRPGVIKQGHDFIYVVMPLSVSSHD